MMTTEIMSRPAPSSSLGWRGERVDGGVDDLFSGGAEEEAA